MAPIETIQVSETRVGDGGGGPLGHPRVFLSLGKEGDVVCPYCSRRFVLVGAGGSASLAAD